MAEDNGKEEEKFDFTPEGEGYISLDEARVLAVRTAVASPGDYGRNFRRVTMVFEVVEATETDDHYTVTLSFRPQGSFDGTPGQEQFVIGKDGTIAVRQVLSSLVRKEGGFPILPVAIGLVVVGIIAAVGAVIALGSSGGDSVPVAVMPPTETPAPTEAPAPTHTLAPTPTPAPTETPAPTPTFTPMPTYTPYPTPTPRPTYTPRPIPTARVIVVTPTPTPRPTPTRTPMPTLAGSRDSYHEKGMDYYDVRKYQLAVNEFTKAIRVNSSHASTYWVRGMAYGNLGQYQLAIDDYTKAIQIGLVKESYTATVYNLRGIAYGNLGQPTLANADATTACSLDSKYC